MKLRLISVLLIINFILAACASKVAMPPAPQAGVDVTAEDVEAVLKVQPEADECFACHTDKDRLIETAKPEEVVEKESSGAG